MRSRSTRPDRRYAAIPNAAMRDTALSIEARGLLALMMTHSDEWRFSVAQLRRDCCVGRDKIKAMLAELEARGYLRRIILRNARGQLEGSEWIIFDECGDGAASTSSGGSASDADQDGVVCSDNRPPENPAIGGDVTDSLKNRPPVQPSAGESGPIRRPRVKKTKEKPPSPPDDPAARASLEDIARSWVDPVRAGRQYCAGSIRPAVARMMLQLDLVSADELRAVGVNF